MCLPETLGARRGNPEVMILFVEHLLISDPEKQPQVLRLRVAQMTAPSGLQESCSVRDRWCVVGDWEVIPFRNSRRATADPSAPLAPSRTRARRGPRRAPLRMTSQEKMARSADCFGGEAGRPRLPSVAQDDEAGGGSSFPTLGAMKLRQGRGTRLASYGYPRSPGPPSSWFGKDYRDRATRRLLNRNFRKYAGIFSGLCRMLEMPLAPQPKPSPDETNGVRQPATSHFEGPKYL